MKWPGDEDPIFSLTSVYVPRGRSNLASYMAVDADAASPNYGQLRILRMSDTTQIDGPGQTANAMVTNETVAERLRPFQQGTAQASYGNLLTLPVGGGLLYVQPVYTQRQGSTGSYPALRFVLARFGQQVGIGDTLAAGAGPGLRRRLRGEYRRDQPERRPVTQAVGGAVAHDVGLAGQPGGGPGPGRGEGRVRSCSEGAHRR